MSKLCHKCGEPLANPNVKFCPKCGAKQETAVKSSPATAVEPKPQVVETPKPSVKETYTPVEPVMTQTVETPRSAVAEPSVQTAKAPEPSKPIVTETPKPAVVEMAVVPEPSKPAVAEPSKPKPNAVRNEAAAQKYVNEIENVELKESLYPLISPFVHGYKGFYVGNRGSKKEKAYKDLARVLMLSGKAPDEEFIVVPFNEMPQTFEPNRLYVITNLQAAINYLFNLDDFSNESTGNQRVYQDMLEKLIQIPNSYYIVLDGTIVEYKGFVTLDPRIPFLFKNTIYYDDLTDKEVYDEFYRQLPDDYKKMTTPEYEKNLIDYLDRNRRFYPFGNVELAGYLAGECTQKGSLEIPKERHQTKSLEELFSNIIGMQNVKDKLVELNNFLSARTWLEEHGAVMPKFGLNMLFLGNPGVGKTTIARIVAKILFDLGYIREEKLIECTSKDLVSAYSGLTGVKTNRVISRAMGGVLFIDEAYALSNSCGQAGDEAIAILIKAMEDYKGEIVVMFAGYTKEMDDFVRSNSGIESRINYNFYFTDYTTDELLEIFKLKLGRTHMKITDEGVDAARDILKNVAGRRNFGNGRFVDKMLQATLTKHASLGLADDELMTIRKESIPKIDEIMKS